MARRRAVLSVNTGPNKGDTVSVEIGSCRLIGRHLSEAETAFIDRDGCRVLDGSASEIVTSHLKDRSPDTGAAPRQPARQDMGGSGFERGPDIIFADDSISRAHAMVFFDETGFGVIDLASTNGTFVGDARISSVLVEDGQAITVGNSELALEME